MKLPDHLFIEGERYDLTVRPLKRVEGLTRFNKKKQSMEIVINNKGVSEREMYDTLIHEVLESIIKQKFLSYINNHDDMLFIMNHKEFTDIVRELSSTLYKLHKNTIFEEEEQQDDKGQDKNVSNNTNI